MQSFIWLSNLNTTSLNINFYTQTFPNILINGTLESINALSAYLDADQLTYTTNLLSTITYFEALTGVAIGLAAVLMVILRMRDNISLMDYLGVVERIKSELLISRGRELKSALGQLHHLRSNCITGIDFSQNYIVSIRKDK
jgi:hypothetical protein